MEGARSPCRKIGAKRLGDFEKRKDTGTKRKGSRKREDKDTAAGFKRAQLKVVANEAVILFGPSSQTAFGFKEMTQAKLERLRADEESILHRSLTAKMEKKHAER